MLLAFDVGNTNTVLGVFRDGNLIESWRLETNTNKSADEYGMIISQLFEYSGLKVEDVEDVIVSTVVPSVLFTIQHMSMKYMPCWLCTEGTVSLPMETAGSPPAETPGFTPRRKT